jgi:hypothetical protein
METQTFTFASSHFVLMAIGFFGLATGYFIWGGQALFGFSKTSPEVNRTMGIVPYGSSVDLVMDFTDPIIRGMSLFSLSSAKARR